MALEHITSRFDGEIKQLLYHEGDMATVGQVCSAIEPVKVSLTKCSHY